MRLCAPRRLAPFPSSFTSSSSRKRESRKSRLKSSPSSSSFKDDDGCGFLDDDDSDDDDSKVRCIALPDDDDDDEKVDAFLSKTIIDSENEDGPGTFALLTRMKRKMPSFRAKRMTSKAHQETHEIVRNVATRQIRHAYVSARKKSTSHDP